MPGRSRKASAVLESGHRGGHNLARTLMKHAGTAVVAQAAPDGEDIIERGRGQGCDIRKALEENIVVIKNGVNAGLLQHYFREPDGIGIAGAAPGQVAPICVIPRQQSAPKLLDVASGDQGNVLAFYRHGLGRRHHWLTLCAMMIHPAFCCCQTVIMCCGMEGSGPEPAVPLSVIV